MFVVDNLIFFGGLLILVAVVARKFLARFGVPMLVLFLLVGMLAGSEGLGGIEFVDFEIAHGIGTIALAVILFDGGLRTPLSSLRLAGGPALSLATVGVLITATLTGLAATWILGIPLLQGLLLGSIVASTDAAAVFSILRTEGIHLNDRLAATLEVESGSNDPMAIFLTVGLLEVLLQERSFGWGLISLFVIQIGFGGVFGYAMGRISSLLVNRINLDAAGLYPVLLVVLGLFTYGLTASLGGSGFLAVYVPGIVIGSRPLVFQRGSLLFQDGLAWLSQIAMFVVLGLLSFPSDLLNVAWQGMAVAAFLVLAARPVAVFMSLLPFPFNVREYALISWVGLKGAVPIILATYPLLLGLEGGLFLFNVVFFVVIVSAVTQGWSLPAVARKLDLLVEQPRTPPVSLDITSLRDVKADIVEYEIRESSEAAHLRISELQVPEDVVIAMVARGDDIIPARGPTVLLPGDHIFTILRPELREHLDKIFGHAAAEPATPRLPIRAGVYLPCDLTLREFEDLYDERLEGDPETTLAAFIEKEGGKRLTEGDFVETGHLRLFVPPPLPGGQKVVGFEWLHD